MRKNLLKTLLVAVGLVMGVNAWAAEGDKVTVVDQTFPGELESTDTYTWGSELSDMLRTDGLYMTNNNNTANNYENRDFLTFANAIGDETHEVNVAYEVYSPKDKGQANTNYTISYFNKEGDFVFAIQETSGGWAYGCNVIYAKNDGTTETAALSAGHMKKAGGSTVSVSVKFTGNNAVVTIDGNTYSAYTQSAGLKAVKLSVTGGSGYDRDMYVKSYKVGTTEIAAVKVAKYTLKYVAGDVELKTVEKSGTVGESIALMENEKAALYNEDNTQKYIYVSDDAEGKTIAEDGLEVVTITYRAAEKFAYTLKSSLGGIIKEGTDWEGETFDIAYPRYLAQDGTLYSAGKGSAGWYLKTFEMTHNNVEATIDYTATKTTSVAFLAEAEDIETLTVSTAANSNARCSNGLGAYNAGENDALITTLPAGKYELYTSTWGGTGVDFIFKAGETTIGTFTCIGSIIDYNTEEFVLTENTDITLGATTNPARCIDFVYIIKTGDATETVSIGEAGLATYCPTVGVDFTDAKNIEAYKATINADASTVTLTKVTTVAAGEGVLLRSIAGDAATEDIPVAVDAQKNDGNDFVGVETDIESLATETDGHTNYILNNVDGVIGFYKAAGNSVAAGKAYLQVLTTAANAKSLKIVFGDTTGISEINNTAKADGAYYSISGVRVANPTKGLYIQNGKKVIVK